MNASAWFVTETLPRSEFRAFQHLERQRYRCFFPRFRKTRRHARRVDEVLAPLFPGYLFVQFDPARDQWRSINGTYGVKRLVSRPSGEPQPMPAGAMDALFARCRGDIAQSVLADVTPGRQVRLMSGPFAEQLAQIERLDDRGRAWVLLDILGRASSISLPVDCLGPV